MLKKWGALLLVVMLSLTAAGSAELIRDQGVTPDQICVLFWSNRDCASLAEALAEWNISASAPSGTLLSTAECQLVMAAFRYCIDPGDQNHTQSGCYR